MIQKFVKNPIVAITLLICLGIAGYAFYDTLSNSPGKGDKTSQATDGAKPIKLLEVGTQAPDFYLTGIDGKSYSLSQYQGQKWVLLEFFASWCPHCQRSVEQLNTIQKTLATELVVLAINAGDKPPRASTSAEFQKNYKTRFAIMDYPPQIVLDEYGLRAFPTTYLIDKQGRITWAHQGDITKSHTQEIVKQVKGTS